MGRSAPTATTRQVHAPYRMSNKLISDFSKLTPPCKQVRRHRKPACYDDEDEFFEDFNSVDTRIRVAKILGFDSTEHGAIKSDFSTAHTWRELKSQALGGDFVVSIMPVKFYLCGYQGNPTNLEIDLPEGSTWVDNAAVDIWHDATHILFHRTVAIPVHIGNTRFAKMVEQMVRHIEKLVALAGQGRWGIKHAGAYCMLKKGIATTPTFTFLC